MSLPALFTTLGKTQIIQLFDNGADLQLDRGYLIVFEGIDGTGKSTHCTKLAEYLGGKGFPIVQLFEPTRGFWGQKIRKILAEGRKGVAPEEELSWFVNDRKEDVEKNILPALEKKKIVLMDRYYYSTAAYQGALGFDPQKIIRENELFAPKPDRVFIFFTSPEQCLQRIEKSRSGHSAFEREDYLQKVQDLFETFSGPAIRRIDSHPPIEPVFEEVRRGISDLLPV